MKRITVLILGFLVWAPAGLAQGIITTIAGNGTLGFSGDGGPATRAQVSSPCGLAVDAAGNLYISDTDNMRVRKVNPAGIIMTVAGNGEGDFTGDVGSATTNSLWFPKGVAVDSAGNLFISDQGNDRVRKVSPSGQMTTVAGGGPCCSLRDGGVATRATLKEPSGLGLDADGGLYIADEGHNRIRKVSPHGTITTVAGYGAQGLYGDGGPATSAPLSFAEDLAVDAAGNVYIAHSRGVRKVNPTGTITNVAGGPYGSPDPTDGAPATSVYLQNAGSVAVDVAGSLYLAVTDRVYRVSSSGNITRAAGGGSGQGDGLPARDVRLNYVRALAADAAGNLYIATDDRVYKVTP